MFISGFPHLVACSGDTSFPSTELPAQGALLLDAYLYHSSSLSYSSLISQFPHLHKGEFQYKSQLAKCVAHNRGLLNGRNNEDAEGSVHLLIPQSKQTLIACMLSGRLCATAELQRRMEDISHCLHGAYT